MLSNKKIVVACFAFLAASLAFSLSSCSQHRPAKPASASSAPLEFGSAVRALKSGNDGEGEAKLARVRVEYPSTLWAARASFLSGVRAVERGEAGAGAMLEGAGALGGSIPEYLAFYRARAHAIDGEHAKALVAVEPVIDDYPASPLLIEALFLRASSLLALGRTGEAAIAFESIASAHPSSDLAPGALLKAAEARIKLGDDPAAAVHVKKILVEYPADETAGEAVRLVESLSASFPAQELELTLAEKFRRADRLFKSARFEEAALEYSLLSADPAGPLYGPSVIRRAESMIRLKRYGEARGILDGYLEPGAPRSEALEREALYWAALVSLRQGSEKGLVSAVERLSAGHPRTRELAGVLIFLGRHYESRSMEAEATGAFTRVMDDFEGTASAREAAWNVGWAHYRAGRFDRAIQVFSTRPAPGNDGDQMFLYWRARSAEKLGDADGAELLYRRLCAESYRDYYCRMAEKRLAHGLKAPIHEADTGGAPGNGEALFKDSFSGLTSSARYIAAMELLTLGLDARSAEETAKLAGEYSKEPAPLVFLAELFYRAGDFHRAFRLYYSYLTGLSSGPPGLPDLAALSFPPRLVDQLRQSAPAGSVDPYLVAAVMREESAFNPGAVSSTGAMGLMQIMPSTGRYIAGKLGRGLADAQELLDPELNIELGSWYLGHLARRFDNDLVLTIAGYNAGPAAVARWTQTLPTELDEFIESIPYPETRRYAKKVLKSYGEFLRLDGVDTSGLLSRPVLDGLDAASAPPLLSDEAQSSGADERS